jgi:hypothetical protein
MRSSVRSATRVLALLTGASLAIGIGSGVAAGLARLRMTSRGDETSDEVSLRVIFDGLDFVSRAAAFRGGSVVAWYGGTRIDLRQATLDPAGATLELRAVFGGISLLVPPGWRVEAHGIGVLGGTGSTVASDGLPDDAPRLRVLSFAVFGGIAVTAPAAGEPAPA